jgi:Na+-translocating ferredoxin:NAD+ oxidoreductase subunit B
MSIIIIVTLTSFILSLFIVYIDYRYNKLDDYEKEIMALLPGYNCGMCGHGSCQGMTDAMIEDPKEYKKCRPMKKEQVLELVAYLRKKRKLLD